MGPSDRSSDLARAAPRHPFDVAPIKADIVQLAVGQRRQLVEGPVIPALLGEPVDDPAEEAGVAMGRAGPGGGATERTIVVGISRIHGCIKPGYLTRRPGPAAGAFATA